MARSAKRSPHTRLRYAASPLRSSELRHRKVLSSQIFMIIGRRIISTHMLSAHRRDSMLELLFCWRFATIDERAKPRSKPRSPSTDTDKAPQNPDLPHLVHRAAGRANHMILPNLAKISPSTISYPSLISQNSSKHHPWNT